jgi:ABC-type nitrate/sulfonate/bicarbonate transport system substrate-binding protein
VADDQLADALPVISRAAVLAAGAAGVVPGVVHAERTTLQVGSMPTDGSAEALYAVDRGSFAAVGIDRRSR